MELNILRADPAGNITVFVLDPVEKAQRAAIAEKIMAIPALKAEQVGYALSLINISEPTRLRRISYAVFC